MAPFTRRSLLVGTALSAGMQVASLAPAAASGASVLNPDSGLLSLERTFRQSVAAYETARRYFNVCERRYFDLVPERPKVLTIAGPLGHFLDNKWDWWWAAELRRVLRDEAYVEVWDAARAALPVARAYEARRRRLRRATDVAAAEAANNAAIDRLADMSRLILAAPACSFAGFAVKARVVKSWGRPDWWADGADTDERLAAQVLDAVIAMAERKVA